MEPIGFNSWLSLVSHRLYKGNRLGVLNGFLGSTMRSLLTHVSMVVTHRSRL